MHWFSIEYLEKCFRNSCCNILSSPFYLNKINSLLESVMWTVARIDHQDAQFDAGKNLQKIENGKKRISTNKSESSSSGSCISSSVATCQNNFWWKDKKKEKAENQNNFAKRFLVGKAGHSTTGHALCCRNVQTPGPDDESTFSLPHSLSAESFCRLTADHLTGESIIGNISSHAQLNLFIFCLLLPAPSSFALKWKKRQRV